MKNIGNSNLRNIILIQTTRSIFTILRITGVQKDSYSWSVISSTTLECFIWTSSLFVKIIVLWNDKFVFKFHTSRTTVYEECWRGGSTGMGVDHNHCCSKFFRTLVIVIRIANQWIILYKLILVRTNREKLSFESFWSKCLIKYIFFQHNRGTGVRYNYFYHEISPPSSRPQKRRRKYVHRKIKVVDRYLLLQNPFGIYSAFWLLRIYKQAILFLELGKISGSYPSFLTPSPILEFARRKSCGSLRGVIPWVVATVRAGLETFTVQDGSSQI